MRFGPYKRPPTTGRSLGKRFRRQRRQKTSRETSVQNTGRPTATYVAHLGHQAGRCEVGSKSSYAKRVIVAISKANATRPQKESNHFLSMSRHIRSHDTWPASLRLAAPSRKVLPSAKGSATGQEGGAECSLIHSEQVALSEEYDVYHDVQKTRNHRAPRV